jgi:hypothetical protein
MRKYIAPLTLVILTAIWEFAVQFSTFVTLITTLRSHGQGGAILADFLLSPLVRLALFVVCLVLVYRAYKGQGSKQDDPPRANSQTAINTANNEFNAHNEFKAHNETTQSQSQSQSVVVNVSGAQPEPDKSEPTPKLNFECIRAGFIDVEIDMSTFEIRLTPDQYGGGMKCKAAVAEFRRNTDDSRVESISIRAIAELRGREGESLSINEGRWLVHDREEKRRATIPFRRLDTKRLAVVLGISNNKVYTYEGRYVKSARLGLTWIYTFKHELQYLSEAVYDVEIWLAGSYGGSNIVDDHFGFELIRGAELKDSIFRKKNPCLLVPGVQPDKAERIRRLSEFAEEGDRIIANGKGVEVDWPKAKEWAKRAETYIWERVGEESAAYFSLETREHAFPGGAVNRTYVDWVYTRIQRIAELASEVRKQ